MSWTRGRTNNGKFYIEAFDFAGNLTDRVTNIETAAEADALGQAAERHNTLKSMSPQEAGVTYESDMTTDEILKELGL